MSSMRLPEAWEVCVCVGMSFCVMYRCVSVCRLTRVGHDEGLHLDKDLLSRQPDVLQLPREVLKFCI